MSLYVRLCKAAAQLRRGEGLTPYADFIESVAVETIPDQRGVLISIDDETRARVDYVLPPAVADKLLAALAQWKVSQQPAVN